MLKIIVAVVFNSLLITSCKQSKKEISNAKTIQAGHEKISINTPDEALAELKNGNSRFVNEQLVNTDFKHQIEHTKEDQHPHSVILSCLDSRIPPEIIFDQGIGNIFVARVAGNIEDPNIIGSMEFATKLKGAKLIVVMGHNHCGAVKGAVGNAQLGKLTQLIEQIRPAIASDTSNAALHLDETSKNNIKLTITDILRDSEVISQLIKENKVKMIGAYYDITTGKVIFLE